MWKRKSEDLSYLAKVDAAPRQRIAKQPKKVCAPRLLCSDSCSRWRPSVTAIHKLKSPNRANPPGNPYSSRSQPPNLQAASTGSDSRPLLCDSSGVARRPRRGHRGKTQESCRAPCTRVPLASRISNPLGNRCHMGRSDRRSPACQASDTGETHRPASAGTLAPPCTCGRCRKTPLQPKSGARHSRRRTRQCRYCSDRCGRARSAAPRHSWVQCQASQRFRGRRRVGPSRLYRRQRREGRACRPEQIACPGYTDHQRAPSDGLTWKPRPPKKKQVPRPGCDRRSGRPRPVPSHPRA